MKLLLVEDEQVMLKSLLNYFKKEGYICEQATTYKEGYKKINNHYYDCALIDLHLPGGQGINLVKILHREVTQTAILIISANSDVKERIAGLNAGADDFLVKPIHFGELKARIKAIVRRKINTPVKELAYGDLTIRPEEREVVANKKILKLTKKEFDILLYLIRNKNRVMNKASIAEHLWGDYMDEADSFDFIYAHVKNLRKKLADNGCGKYLQTVYGIGYKFSVNV